MYSNLVKVCFIWFDTLPWICFIDVYHAWFCAWRFFKVTLHCCSISFTLHFSLACYNDSANVTSYSLFRVVCTCVDATSAMATESRPLLPMLLTLLPLLSKKPPPLGTMVQRTHLLQSTTVRPQGMHPQPQPQPPPCAPRNFTSKAAVAAISTAAAGAAVLTAV